MVAFYFFLFLCFAAPAKSFLPRTLPLAKFLCLFWVHFRFPVHPNPLPLGPAPILFALLLHLASLVTSCIRGGTPPATPDPVHAMLSPMPAHFAAKPPKLAKHSKVANTDNRQNHHAWWATSLSRSLEGLEEPPKLPKHGKAANIDNSEAANRSETTAKTAETNLLQPPKPRKRVKVGLLSRSYLCLPAWRGADLTRELGADDKPNASALKE